MDGHGTYDSPIPAAAAASVVSNTVSVSSVALPSHTPTDTFVKPHTRKNGTKRKLTKAPALRNVHQTTTDLTVRFPPYNALLYGRLPFRWCNTRDTETPFKFLYVEANVLHPSTRFYLQRTRPSTAHSHQLELDSTLRDEWGCDCPGGRCEPATCACSQHARNQYSRYSRVVSQVQPQSLCECWIYCSCHGVRVQSKVSKKRAMTSGMDELASPPPLAIIGQDVLPADANLQPLRSPSPVPVHDEHEMVDVPRAIPSHPATTTTTTLSQSSNAKDVGSSCFNRVVQYGPIAPGLELVVFKTRHKGWGVKTLTRIPKFAFVCEYVGEVIHEHISEQRGIQYRRRGRSNYLFSPEVVPTTSHLASSLHELEAYNVDHECFTIDSQRVGNVARFINHACHPNLLSTNVYIEHRADLRLPRVAFFACETIEPGTELTVYYGYKENLFTEFICQCQQCVKEAKESEKHAKKKLKLSHTKQPEKEKDATKLAELDPAALVDPLEPIPLPERTILLDSSAPPPTTEQILDPLCIYFRTRSTLPMDSDAPCALAQLTKRNVASISPQYIERLEQLIGVGRCIPIETACCRVHIHPSRMTMAAFALQQQFPEARNLDWHLRQIEIMLRYKTSEYDRARTKQRGRSANDLVCSVCHVSFPSRMLLCQHRSIHTPSFQCPLCLDVFDSQALLQVHHATSASVPGAVQKTSPGRLQSLRSATVQPAGPTVSSIKPMQISPYKSPPSPVDDAMPPLDRPSAFSSTRTRQQQMVAIAPPPPPIPVSLPNQPSPTAHVRLPRMHSTPPGAVSAPPSVAIPADSTARSISVLHFEQIHVRLIHISSENTPDRMFTVVLSLDLLRLLGLDPYHSGSHAKLTSRLQSDPHMVAFVPLKYSFHYGWQVPSGAAQKTRPCLTLEGCKRYVDVFDVEVNHRSGLRQWLDSVLWPALSGSSASTQVASVSIPQVKHEGQPSGSSSTSLPSGPRRPPESVGDSDSDVESVDQPRPTQHPREAAIILSDSDSDAEQSMDHMPVQILRARTPVEQKSAINPNRSALSTRMDFIGSDSSDGDEDSSDETYESNSVSRLSDS